MVEVGELVPLGQFLMNLTLMGYVTDIDTPPLMVATMESVGDDAVLTFDVLVGPKGNPGDDAPIANVRWDVEYDVYTDLPPNGITTLEHSVTGLDQPDFVVNDA